MMGVFQAIQSGQISARNMRKALDKENEKFNDFLRPFPTPPHPNPNYVGSWRSKHFLVQVFKEKTATRLSVCRTQINESGTQWRDNISWDDLQKIKNQIGYADKCAVEIFPPESEVVNVANMRHIFVVDEPPSFMWTSQPPAAKVEAV